MANTEIYEELALEIDKIENLVYAMNLPMGDAFHVTQLKEQLPEVVETLKGLYIELTDENPWE